MRIHTIQTKGGHPVEVHQTGIDSFGVVYGEYKQFALSYQEMADQIGNCVMHALTAQGCFPYEVEEGAL